MSEVQPIKSIFPAEKSKQDNKNRIPKPDKDDDQSENNMPEEKIPDPYGRGQTIDKEV